MGFFSSFTCNKIVAKKTNQIDIGHPGFSIGDQIIVGADLPRLVIGVQTHPTPQPGHAQTITIQGVFGINTPGGVQKAPCLNSVPVYKKQKPAPGIHWFAEPGGGLVQWTDTPGPHGGFTVVALAIFGSDNASWPWQRASGLSKIYSAHGVIGSSPMLSFGMQSAASLIASANGLKAGTLVTLEAQASASFPDTPEHSSGVVDVGPTFLSTHIVGVE